MGGWHDAGDYGKYTGPGAVAAAHLLYAWKLFPDGCSEALNITETGNGIPDILNEARYELNWLLQMQRSDGSFHHKLTKAHFAPFIMPQQDLEPEYLMPVTHCATGAACACLALASRVYRTFDPSFSGRLLSASRQAWNWLEANPDFKPFQNPEGVRTGQYGDKSDTDERFWAACELYAATENREYREAALLQWHYALGLNALDTCFVTGFGERSVLHPHHRPSGADGIEEPVPGLISGGPNKCFPYSTTREKLGEATPPAKYYLDETPSADTNEIAIYWNSPAIFVGAFFSQMAENEICQR